MTPTKYSRGPGTEIFQTPIPMLDLTQPAVPFKRLPLPTSGLTFLPRPSLPESRKRGRAAADIDGEHSCIQKKKRRLRLLLITSRLSPQFSHPATNIVNRGNSKIAVWAKQKAIGRNLLRKAAILNRIRCSAVATRDAVSCRRLLVEQEKEQRQLEMARLTFNYGAIDTYTRPVHSPTEPLPPSAAICNGSHLLNAGSPTKSPSTSPTASRSPSPTSIRSTLNPGHKILSDCKSPNAAYALSPPRAQSSIRTYEPHLPSPLGLSNYDAFDVEDLGARDNRSIDAYSYLDDDGEEDRYSYLWDSNEEDRHDSPFSASVLTNDSCTTANTGTSQILKTPSQQAYDTFDEPDIPSSLPGGREESNGMADSVWPSPNLGAATRTAKKSTPREPWYGSASPNFPPFHAGPLAVQYPGAPVPCEEKPAVTTALAGKPDMVPASMSPNFLAADKEDWARDAEGERGTL